MAWFGLVGGSRNAGRLRSIRPLLGGRLCFANGRGMIRNLRGTEEFFGGNLSKAVMSNFEWWFLLVYTVYVAVSILALMWVGREQGNPGRTPGLRLRQPSRVRK